MSLSLPRRTLSYSLIIAMAGSFVSLQSGCEDLPGSRTEQATVIGGAAGAGIGAVIAEENRLLGALIGGLLGAGGGYLIGAETDWFEDDDEEEVRSEVRTAVDEAQTNPATAEEARRATTADINRDGFVTLDEVIAMDRAGFSDDEMLDRLEATGQIFDLNSDQRQVLRDAGISNDVIDQMQDINRAQRDRYLAGDDDDVISR